MVACIRVGAMSKKEVSGIRMLFEHKTNRIYRCLNVKYERKKEIKDNSMLILP